MTTYSSIKNLNSRDQNRNLLWLPYIDEGNFAWSDNSFSTSSSFDKRVFTMPCWNISSNNHGSGFCAIDNGTPYGSGTTGFYAHRVVNQQSGITTPAADGHVVYHTAFTFKDVYAQDPYLASANASPMTLSFFVYSSVTGDFVVELASSPWFNSNFENERKGCSKIYNIASANTWQKVEITFPPFTFAHNDPMVSIDNMYFQLNFWLSAGSNYTSTTLNTSWSDIKDPPSGSNVYTGRATGITNNWTTTQNASWKMMLPQLECAPSSTPFSISPNKDMVTVQGGLAKAGSNWNPITIGHQPDHASFANRVWIKNPYHRWGFGNGYVNLGREMTGSNNFWDTSLSFLNPSSSGNSRFHWGDGGDAQNTTTVINYLDGFHIRIQAPTVPNNYVRSYVAHGSNALSMTSMAFIDLDG